jgi:hypothetical protein
MSVDWKTWKYFKIINKLWNKILENFLIYSFRIYFTFSKQIFSWSQGLNSKNKNNAYAKQILGIVFKLKW